MQRPLGQLHRGTRSIGEERRPPLHGHLLCPREPHLCYVARMKHRSRFLCVLLLAGCSVGGNETEPVSTLQRDLPLGPPIDVPGPPSWAPPRERPAIVDLPDRRRQPCRDAEDCEDPPSPCVENICEDHFCVERDTTDECDDGDACTDGDRCVNGECAPGVPVNCDDDNECTEDVCLSLVGCVHANNTAGCDDGDACTTNDRCFDGMCVGGADVDCDDGNVCTDDICVPQTGCLSLTNANTCDDGDACTTNDICFDGMCAGSAVDCNDGNDCTDDLCDPDTGCENPPNTNTCDDYDACTTNDVCLGGTCVGASVDCNDGNPCTNDVCDQVSGCENPLSDPARPVWDGSQCVSCEQRDAAKPKWDGSGCVSCEQYDPAKPKWDGSGCVSCEEYDPETPRWDGSECVGQPMVVEFWSSWNVPGNSSGQTSTEPSIDYHYGSRAGQYFQLDSSGGPDSLSATVELNNDNCTRSNGGIGGTTVSLYVLGPPGTDYEIEFSWSQTVTAVATRPAGVHYNQQGQGFYYPSLSANTLYSSFGLISVNAEPGDTQQDIASDQGVVTGATTTPTLTKGGMVYSLARSYRLSGAVGGGQCYVCDVGPSNPDCCDCGSARTTTTLDVQAL